MTTAARTHEHKFYRIEEEPYTNASKFVVYDPRWPHKPLYMASTLADAKHFVEHYSRGSQWAVEAALS